MTEVLCGVCGKPGQCHQQIKGGARACFKCRKELERERVAALRRENHELRMELARLKKQQGEYLGPLKVEKRVVTPPEQRWNGYTH